MAIKGSLKEAGLADVCQLLAMGQKTGCLSVTDRSRFGQIFFDRGRITFATIVNRRDRLGDVLVREGFLDHATLMEAVDAQGREPDRRLGELLLDRGAIDAETLTACIQRQIEEAIYYLFTWKRGSFYFEVGKTPDAGEVLISVNPESLLLEGARRVDEWSVIEKKIPSLDLIFQVDGDRLDGTGVRLSPEQESVIRLLDGQRTVEEVAEESGLGEFEAGKVLYGLVQAGFAFRTGRRDSADPAETADLDEARNLGVAFYRTAMLEDADREFRRVLEADPHDATARHYLALISLRSGQAGEAVRRLTALLETSGARLGAFLNLAYALRLQRRWADAPRVLGEARGLAPDDPRVRLAQGATLLFSGDVDGAAPILGAYRAMLRDGDVPPASYYYCAALCAVVDGRTEEADAVLREGLEVHSGAAPLLLLAGNIAERRADMIEAERLYQHAAEEDGSLPQPHKNLGDLAFRRGIHGDALDHYQRAAEAEPDLGDDLYERMGDIYYRRNERDEAIRCWRRALELNPANEQARNHLEVLARAAG
jgi:tetratricopeptide (TPR) repeat protein